MDAFIDPQYTDTQKSNYIAFIKPKGVCYIHFLRMDQISRGDFTLEMGHIHHDIRGICLFFMSSELQYTLTDNSIVCVGASMMSRLLMFVECLPKDDVSLPSCTHVFIMLLLVEKNI